ncbi:hypothetical protein Mal35_23290 [Gimesia maris]|uniref:hypothetical protein n=1 Tax=Gimesia maris TaxID=122 RepID=UPI0011883F36|nr:hypothetical protein [Gimesia maris]QDT78878.1 hypothetical protein Mal35_23290 [Gimesia maris]
MKRFRVLTADFDTRPKILSMDIKDDWEEQVKDNWYQIKNNIKEGLIYSYGIEEYKTKIEDFVSLGSMPFSIIAFHNKFLRQARNSFVSGAYYPCLTACCALGERVLNHLILRLRGNFSGTPEYKKIYRKDSFDNWDLVINTLEKWGVLVPEAINGFRELKEIRNKAIHFNPETDLNDRELALNAFQKLCEIVQQQFGTGGQPWFIEGMAGGISIIKKEYEETPFIKEVIIPQCNLVGYKHRVEKMVGNSLKIVDEEEYEEREISDEEFKELYNNRKV